MSPELVVRHDPDPSIQAESWQLPAEVTGELTRARLMRATTTVVTEDVGFTGYRLVMEVRSGLIFTQVADTPKRDTKLLSQSDGRVVIPVFREFRGWEEQTRGEERVPEAREDDPVTSTEYIAAISVEDGRDFSFYPPPSHLVFT